MDLVLKSFSLALALAAACIPLTGQPAAATDTGAVVAQSGPYHLTRADLDAAFTLYDTAAGETLPAEDRAQLQTILVSEFEHDPATVARNYTQLRQAAAAVKEKNDLFQQAKVREAIWESLAADSPRHPASAAALQVLERRVPVIASGDGLVITRRDVGALFDLQDVVARIAGLEASTAPMRAKYASTEFSFRE